MKTKILSIVVFALIVLPNFAVAQEINLLQMPPEVEASSYVVMDAKSGQVLLEKNSNTQLIAASLTKVITALVVLDAKAPFDKQVAITKSDQTLGLCGRGGACIKAKAGVKFTVNDLFHAAMMPSANNATTALARSTGLSTKQFVAKMNAKAKTLGATRSKFYEPAGLNAGNVVTAADYAKIMVAAFENPYLREIAQKQTFELTPTNNNKYNQTIKNTDKLLKDGDFTMLGAKTGYLKSRYNFAGVLKYQGGVELSIVILRAPHLYTAFADTKELASYAQSQLVVAEKPDPALTASLIRQ